MKLILKMITIISLAILIRTITGFENMIQLKIGLKNKTIEFSGIAAQLFLIKTNYKHLSIHLNNFVNVECIQLSDKVNLTAIKEMEYKCASNATICQSNICLIEDYR